jgi:hypothetical protein
MGESRSANKYLHVDIEGGGFQPNHDDLGVPPPKDGWQRSIFLPDPTVTP